eukprot:382527_1
MSSLTVSASDFVDKHQPHVLKRTITENSILSNDDWRGHDSIRVICRFRPPNKRELAYSRKKHVPDTPPEWDSEQSIRLMRPKNPKSHSQSSMKPFRCALDSILPRSTSQKQIFYLVGQPMILSSLEGFNSTIFAYGQSGSGKTYTMFGPENDTFNVEQFGLIPRCFIYLFQKLNKQLSNNGGNLQDFKVKMELLQIYKRDLLDLLNPNSKVKLIIKTDFRTDSIFVQNLRSVEVSTVEEAFACLTEAQSNRIVAGHALNSVSSRSHMLVMVSIVQRAIDGSVKRSKLNFGDLAGSEDLTKALGNNPDPERKKEAIAINSSLSALTTAMSFLSKGKKPGYRNSPLTHILKDSLGGNSKTIMFVACSPHIYNRNETIRALRFATTAKKVKNKAKKNERQSVQSMKKRIKELELHVASLEAQLVEAKGTKNVLKRVMTRMAVGNDDLGKIDEDVDMNELLQENGDDQELNYIHQISELRKKLEESLESNQELNAQIKSKNMELEQCNNKIDQLLEDVNANKQISQNDQDPPSRDIDTEWSQKPLAFPNIPLPRSRAQTDWIRGSQQNVMDGHEPMESMDGNNLMLKHLQELIVDSQKTTTDMDKEMHIQQLMESIEGLKKELNEKTQMVQTVMAEYEEYRSLLEELKVENEKLKQKHQEEETFGDKVEMGLVDMAKQGKQALLRKYNELCKEHEELKRELRLKKDRIDQLLSGNQNKKNEDDNNELEEANPQPSTCSDGWKSFCVGIGWH